MDNEPQDSARIDYKYERKLDRRYLEFPVRTGILAFVYKHIARIG